MSQRDRLCTVMLGAMLAAAVPCVPASAQRAEPEKRKRVIKTDAEWAKQLTRAQYLVCRLKATDPPFTGKYVHNKQKGTYTCVCCGAELFSSAAKFESGTGWPSFWRPMDRDTLTMERDFAMDEVRTEVMCSQCGAHLGHVFDDGPMPTGLRFCINSTALGFTRDPSTPAKPAAKKQTKRKTPSKPARKSAAKASTAKKPNQAGNEAPKSDKGEDSTKASADKAAAGDTPASKDSPPQDSKRKSGPDGA